VTDRDPSGIQLDSAPTVTTETRAAARRVLAGLGATDLLDMLGLGDTPPPGPAPIVTCPICRNIAPKRGVCRRSRQCRAEAAKAVAS
jgi:hypothetical protein